MRSNMTVRKIKLFAVTTLALLMCAQAGADMGAEGRGGGDDLEQVLNQSKKMIMLSLLQIDEQTLNKMSKNSRDLLAKYRFVLISETNSLIQVDHVSETEFLHMNGSSTWISTGFTPNSPVNVRKKVMQNSIGNVNLQQSLLYVGHELAHHIVGKNEALAWELSGAILEAVNIKIALPRFLLVKNGDYIRVPTNSTYPICHGTAHIEANPFAGTISIVSGRNEYPASPRNSVCDNFYRDMNYIFTCKESNGRTLCSAETVDYDHDHGDDGSTAEILDDGNIIINWRYRFNRLSENPFTLNHERVFRSVKYSSF